MRQSLRLGIALFSLLLFVLSVAVPPQASAGEAQPLRLGWQIPWATQGQLVMGFKHTNIPELLDLPFEYIGFAYGGPLNRAALAGEVDVLLTADQPALVLLSRDPSYRIVSRMMYNRVCIYVPVSSGISDLSQLSGKVVMGPTGAAAERVAMVALAEAGVDLSLLQTGKLDMAQQSALIARSADTGLWDGVDALYGFDPLPAVFKLEGKAKILHCGKVVSVVVASDEMLNERRDQLEAFLKGFRLSWNQFRKDPARLNEVFSRESRLNVSNEVLDDAASIEPNRWAASYADLRFDFSTEDLAVLDQASKFLSDKGITKSPIDARDFIDIGLMHRTGEAADVSALIDRVSYNE